MAGESCFLGETQLLCRGLAFGISAGLRVMCDSMRSHITSLLILLRGSAPRPHAVRSVAGARDDEPAAHLSGALLAIDI